MTVIPDQANRRFSYLRRRIAVFGTLLVVILLALYFALTLLSPLATTAARTSAFTDKVRASPTFALPDYGSSAIGVVGHPEAVATGGDSSPLPMASISKIITTLVVLAARPLAAGAVGPTITLTAADTALVAKYAALDGETRPMVVGAKITELDFIRVALIASANNYADALALWAFGSQPAFLSATHAWLTTHGLAHTTIVEPTGIDARNTSTATDLVSLGKLAIADPVVSSIVSTRSSTVDQVGPLQNTNTLLGSGVAGIEVDGIKTGTLNGSSNLLFTAKLRIGDQTVVTVGAVLGGTNHKAVDATVTAMLAAMKANFHVVVLSTRGQPFATFSTAWKQDASALASRTASILVWGNTSVTAVVDASSLSSAARSSGVGRVTFTNGARHIVVPLVLSRSIIDPGTWWRITNPAAFLP